MSTSKRNPKKRFLKKFSKLLLVFMNPKAINSSSKNIQFDLKNGKVKIAALEISDKGHNELDRKKVSAAIAQALKQMRFQILTDPANQVFYLIDGDGVVHDICCNDGQPFTFSEYTTYVWIAGQPRSPFRDVKKDGDNYVFNRETILQPL